MTKHFAPPYERKSAGDSGASFAEIKTLVEQGNRAVDALKSEMDSRIHGVVGKIKGEVDGLVEEKLAKQNVEISELKTALNTAVASLKRPMLGKDGQEKSADLVSYEKAFNQWFRKGVETQDMRELERKALSVGDDSAGGFTVLPEMDQAITDVLIQISPMRGLASTMTIGTDRYRRLVNQRGTSSGWVGETDSRTATNNPVLSELEFPVFEIYAMPTATQQVLDDSFINIETWLAGEVQTEFAYQEGVAFVQGDGVKKPRGFIGGYSPVANASYAWGRPGFIGTGTSGSFSTAPGDDIISLVHALKTQYRQRPGTSFLMNTTTMAAVRKIKDGSGQYYLLSPNFSTDGATDRMMGFPVVEMVAMDDIAANSYSIAFGNWSEAYLVVDRMGTRVLRDPYTNRPYIQFYTTKRVGGGVKNFEAYKLLKFA